MNFQLGLSIFLIYNFFYLVNLEKQVLIEGPTPLLEGIEDFCYHITLILTVIVLLSVWFIFRLMIFLKEAKSLTGKSLVEAIWLIVPGILLLVMCFSSNCGEVHCMEGTGSGLPPRVPHYVSGLSGGGTSDLETLVRAEQSVGRPLAEMVDPEASARSAKRLCLPPRVAHHNVSADLLAFASKAPQAPAMEQLADLVASQASKAPVVSEPVEPTVSVQRSGRILHRPAEQSLYALQRGEIKWTTYMVKDFNRTVVKHMFSSYFRAYEGAVDAEILTNGAVNKLVNYSAGGITEATLDVLHKKGFAGLSSEEFRNLYNWSLTSCVDHLQNDITKNGPEAATKFPWKSLVADTKPGFEQVFQQDEAIHLLADSVDLVPDTLGNFSSSSGATGRQQGTG